jgi:hypothetical protein
MLVIALIDVATSVAATPVLVQVGAEVAISRVIRPRMVGVVLVDLLLDGGGAVCCAQVSRLCECRLDGDVADLDATLFSSTRVVATRR